MLYRQVCGILIGASWSKPHASLFNYDFSYIIMQVDTLLTENSVHTEYLCGWNIEKNVVKVIEDDIQTLAPSYLFKDDVYSRQPGRIVGICQLTVQEIAV